MRSAILSASLFLLTLTGAFAAESAALTKTLDAELRGAENDVVPLVEAMPADKFNFAPSKGEFKGVRTFSQQAGHIATVIYMVCAPILGENMPVDAGKGENGPDLKTKEEVVKYLKDAFAYGHKAIARITTENMLEPLAAPFGGAKMNRLALANVAAWHSFDHYGQMVVYARMEGTVPPASK